MMSARLMTFGLILAAIDLGWAVFLVVQIRGGAAAPWLAWIVPLPIAAGLYIGVDVVWRYWRERA
jgi:H+/Cl- antiporter ClcA